MDFINPFTNTGPISNPLKLLNRQVIIEGILNGILSSPSQNIAIVGQYKIGKTSLVRCLFSPSLLSRHNKANYIEKIQVLFIDCEKYAARLNNSDDFYSMLIIEANNQQVIGHTKLYHNTPPREVWADVVTQSKISEKQLIVIFDQFEFCFKQENLIKQNVFGDLHDSDFTWITCTTTYLHKLQEEVISKLNLDEYIQQSLSSFVYEVQSYVLDLFSDIETRNMIRQSSIDMTDDDEMFIKDCGGNFPYFAHRALFHFYAARQAGIVNKDLIKRLFLREVRPIWERFWKHLNKAQQTLLLKIAKDETVETSYDLATLKDLSLIADDGRGNHKFFSEEFRCFVQEKNDIRTTKKGIVSRKRKVTNHHADILLVTATKTETYAVMKLRKKFKRRIINRKTYYDLGVIKGRKIFMTRTEMGSGGVAGSQNTIKNALRALSPSVVIMVGIAFGTRPDKHAIGDILVSQMIMAYEAQRIGQNRVIPRGERVVASLDLLDKFRDGEINGWKGAPVRFGLLLSGEKLIDNEEFRNKLLEMENEAIGGEMEGGGLYSAVRDLMDFKGKSCSWIIVKSICDWADGKKSSGVNLLSEAKRQERAAANAAKFVFHVLKQGGVGYNTLL